MTYLSSNTARKFALGASAILSFGFGACTTAFAGPSCDINQGTLLPAEARVALDETDFAVLPFEHQAAAIDAIGDGTFMSVRDPALLNANWAQALALDGARETYLVSVCVFGGAGSDDEELFNRWASSRYIKASFAGVERTLQTHHYALGGQPDKTSKLVYVAQLPLPLVEVVSEGAIAAE